MNLTLAQVVPFVCAVIYVVAALMLKRASVLGVGSWRIGFLANWSMFLLFLPWGLMQPALNQPTLGDFVHPALNGLLFLAGQTFIFRAIQSGDVSVTTPVMGTKVLLVALLSLLLRTGEVSVRWWIGAGLSTAAVALLHFGEPHAGRARVGRTVMLASLSALTFSLSDVLLQKWSGEWGGARYLMWMFLFSGLGNFAFVPFFSAPLWAMDRRAWAWTGIGALLLGANNVGFALAIALGGAATQANIIYSVRGLLSVGFVWAIGHWFANEERQLGPRVLRARLAGAALMLAAIILVLI